MKKLILLLIISAFSFSLKSNPLMAPNTPIISEIYFDANGDWTIEFRCFHSFDNLMLETSSGTSAFKSGINLTDSIILITKDSLISPLTINASGDYIRIIDGSSWFESENYFYFGNYQYSYVSALKPNQSYVLYPVGWAFCSLVKENKPTIGFLNNDFPSTGTFTGYVLDKDSLPIFDGTISCLITSYNYETNAIYDNGETYDVNLFENIEIPLDENGYFSIDFLYGRKYDLKFYSDKGDYLYDTLISINIEPDSINSFLFKLNCDKIFVGNEELNMNNVEFSSFPNPISSKINFSYNLKGKNYKNAVIKIFSIDGDLVKILRIPNSLELNTFEADLTEIKQGNYICNLELDGNKIATNKIVIIR